MRRDHRRAHWLVWLCLTPVLAFALYAGLAARQPFPAEDPVVDPEWLQTPSPSDPPPADTEENR